MKLQLALGVVHLTRIPVGERERVMRGAEFRKQLARAPLMRDRGFPIALHRGNPSEPVLRFRLRRGFFRQPCIDLRASRQIARVHQRFRQLHPHR
jgi:hypothetical protein